MEDRGHTIRGTKLPCMWKFICLFLILINCDSLAQTINPVGTYVSAHHTKNTFILKKNHTFIFYWYGETYLKTDKNAPLSFTGKGTWTVKNDTIDAGLALFLEFEETKGAGSTYQERIAGRYVFLDRNDKRICSLIYLNDEERYEIHECFDKKGSSKK